MPWKYMGSGRIPQLFLTSTLDWGDWSASCPGRFNPGIRWISGWVGPRTGLENVEKWKTLFLAGLDLRPFGHPARSHYISRFYRVLRMVYTYLLAYVRSWALPNKLPIVQPFRKFPAILRNPKFHRRVYRALHWSLSWASSIQSIPSHPISLRSILILWWCITHRITRLSDFVHRPDFK
jgi:hypothetical protein